jgi:hypothetical protein
MNRDMDEYISKGNHAIAVFMYDYYDTGLEPAYYIRQNKEYRLTEAQYHSSWDWLMTAIDKIETLDFKVYFDQHSCQIYRKYADFPDNFIIDADFKETRIENAFDGIVSFAEWWMKKGSRQPALQKYSEFEKEVDSFIDDWLPEKILFKEDQVFETELRPGKTRRWYPVYPKESSIRAYLEKRMRSSLYNIVRQKENL